MKNYLYDVLNAKEGGKEPVKSKYKTIGLFSWNLSPRVGFNLRLSSRGDKYYFEDLQLGVSINAKVNAQQEKKDKGGKKRISYGFPVHLELPVHP